jgi:hypothetical protein
MGAFQAWEAKRFSAAAASQRGLHRRSSGRFDPRVATIMTSGREAFVAMVQAAHLGERDDLALVRTLYWSRFRGIFVQPQVGPTAMIVREVGFEQAVQVNLIEHGDVVQALAAGRAHKPFDLRRLPGERGRSELPPSQKDPP